MSDLKSYEIELPDSGFVFWPVGTGDSTTVCVAPGVVMQVDLRHLECANEEGDPHAPVVDLLEAVLPEVSGRPYLSVFALTHPDQDHCLGFSDLLERVTIGEIWFTPRILSEYIKDLCDDAEAFRREAARRVKVMVANGPDVDPGDRVRIIGYDALLEKDEYQGFPDEKLTVPSNEITELDGEDLSGGIRVFVHAPFRDDSAGERNDTSLGLQISLYSGEKAIRGLFLGDLCYPTVKRIFDVSDDDDRAWNVLLCPHHCSKSVMYWKDEDDADEILKQELMDQIEAACETPGYIVASSEPIPSSNKKGDDPPHAKAKDRYEEIAPDGFLCTHGQTEGGSPPPIVFGITEDGSAYCLPEAGKLSKEGSLAAAVAQARGSDRPPTERVGFGGGA